MSEPIQTFIMAAECCDDPLLGTVSAQRGERADIICLNCSMVLVVVVPPEALQATIEDPWSMIHPTSLQGKRVFDTVTP